MCVRALAPLLSLPPLYRRLSQSENAVATASFQRNFGAHRLRRGVTFRERSEEEKGHKGVCKSSLEVRAGREGSEKEERQKGGRWTGEKTISGCEMRGGGGSA